MNTELDRRVQAFIGSMAPEASIFLSTLSSGLHDNAANSRQPSELFPRPSKSDPQAITSVGIIGGGTAGYLTALTLRAKRPWLDVTLVESIGIGIIGVGEATVPSMVPYLHNDLGIDPTELYRRVAPTWKLGIRFDWGTRPNGFMAPFDWHSDSVGVLGSLATQGDTRAFTLQSLLMAADKTPVFQQDNEAPLSLLPYLPFAYHLDNARFVRFLTDLAEQRGVKHVDATIAQVALSAHDCIDHLRTKDGRVLDFDFYVDCTGFRSLLLDDALSSPYTSYVDSLSTDRAVTGVLPHNGHIKPYTSALTMDGGWTWNIPTRYEDHVGYVHSSHFTSEDAAGEELQRRFPEVSNLKSVRFKVGRHEEIWKGNVFAVGNSYAFVEPLESSGLMMITLEALTLAATLPGSWADPAPRTVVNTTMRQRWDAIRWFLAIHYRFNGQRDTPFWRHSCKETDVSGLEPLLDVFRAGAPLQFRNPFIRSLLEEAAPTFYGLEGFDCILLGQGVPARILPSEERPADWQARKDAADLLVHEALPAADALRAYDEDESLHDELLQDTSSWVVASGTRRLVSKDPHGNESG